MGTISKVRVNRLNHPWAHRVSMALAQLIRVPLVRISDWQVVSDESLTASAGDLVGVEAGSFTMIVANRHTAQALTIKGAGGGAGVGPGLLPVDTSGDAQRLPKAPGPLGAVTDTINYIGGVVKLPKLPGWNSPIYLGRGGADSMGPRLFAGPAAIYSVGLGAGIEISCGVLVFSGSPGIKALTILAGLDYLSNASIGASGLIYLVTATPLNQCTVTPV